MSVASWTLSRRDGRLTIVGRLVETLLGKHTEELENLDALLAHIAREDRPATAAWFAAPGAPECEFRMTAVDGREVWIQSVAASRIETVDPAAARSDISGVFIDVTEMRASQRALDAALKRQADFAAVASEWHWEQGPDLRFTYHTMPIEATAPLCEVDTRIGKTLRELIGPIAETPPFQEHLRRLEARKPFRSFEYEPTRRDGKRQVISVNGEPFYDETGAFAGYRGVCRDVTEAKLTEEALRASKEEAERASRAKSEFLAQMSHELRTPLNAIIGFAEIMSKQISGPLPEHYRDYAEDIRRSGEHLLTLICDILDLSKIEAGKHELHVEEIDVGEVMAACLRMVREPAAEAGLRLELSMAKEPPRLMADARAMKQIVLNLLANAVRFTDAGGAVTLSADLCAETGDFLFAIRDEGVGMAPGELEQAFEPFTQVGNSIERRNAGTGLGLSLVLSLARLHDGEVHCESARGKGTTVTVRLPAARVVRRQNAFGESAQPPLPPSAAVARR